VRISSTLKTPCSIDIKSLQVFTNLLQLAATCMCQTMPEGGSNRRQPSALPQQCKVYGYVCTYMRYDTSGIAHNMYAASACASVSHKQQFSDPPYTSCKVDQRRWKVAKLAERCSTCSCTGSELYREYGRISQLRGKGDR